MTLNAEVATALAEDAATLALLHDRELSPALMAELKRIRFPANFLRRYMLCRFPITKALLVVASLFPFCASAKAPEARAGDPPAYIAGTVPDQRPRGAPVIREFVRTADWRTRALTGVSEPFPASLDFLDRQGAWYTPFSNPGMPGYYDLRAWHRGPAESGKQGR